MTGNHLFQALRQLTAALDRLGIDYMVGGSVAAVTHGEIRSTSSVC